MCSLAYFYFVVFIKILIWSYPLQPNGIKVKEYRRSHLWHRCSVAFIHRLKSNVEYVTRQNSTNSVPVSTNSNSFTQRFPIVKYVSTRSYGTKGTYWLSWSHIIILKVLRSSPWIGQFGTSVPQMTPSVFFNFYSMYECYKLTFRAVVVVVAW
jgi:hypothetical protein